MAVLLKHHEYTISHAKLFPGWVLIWVNFDITQETGPKVGDGCSFRGDPFLRATVVLQVLLYLLACGRKANKISHYAVLSISTCIHTLHSYFITIQNVYM